MIETHNIKWTSPVSRRTLLVLLLLLLFLLLTVRPPMNYWRWRVCRNNCIIIYKKNIPVVVLYAHSSPRTCSSWLPTFIDGITSAVRQIMWTTKINKKQKKGRPHSRILGNLAQFSVSRSPPLLRARQPTNQVLKKHKKHNTDAHTQIKKCNVTVAAQSLLLTDRSSLPKARDSQHPFLPACLLCPADDVWFNPSVLCQATWM